MTDENFFIDMNGQILEGKGSETYGGLVEELRNLRADHEMLTRMVGKLARRLKSEEDDEDDDEEGDMLPLIIDETDGIRFVSLLLEDEGAFNEFLIKNVVPEDDWLRALVYNELDIGDNRMVIPQKTLGRSNLYN
jgi:hypothetical protein